MRIELDDPAHVQMLKAVLVSQARQLRKADRATHSRMWDATIELLLEVADKAKYAPADAQAAWWEAVDQDEEYISFLLKKQAE